MDANEIERYAAGMDLIVFLNRYTELVEGQLSAIRSVIENAVRTVMEGISTIAEETASKASEANSVLDNTYMNPDQATTELVKQIQSSVDSVFEMAQMAMGNPGNKDGKEGTEENLRRLGGQFSKHMEAVSSMDEALGSILVEMMGALSADDLIRQKLEHILLMVHGLQVGLSYIMIDFKKKFAAKEVQTLINDLLYYAYSSYTAEVEKQFFKQRFPEPSKVAFSIFRS